MFAPVVLFTYKRPIHTKIVLDALSNCDFIQETDVIRVYVQPENIKLTEKGIHLDLEDGQKIILPNIQSNENGLYTSLSNNDSRKYLHYTCPGCGVTYYWWENCSTPGCSKNSQG